MVTSKQCDRIIIGFCLTICLLALFIVSFREVGAFGVESDFYEVYAVQAENILAGDFYTYKHNPPGYCLLLAAKTFLTGDTFVAGKLISAFATGFFGWISYLLLKTLFGHKIAFISTIFLLLTLIPSSFLLLNLLGYLLLGLVGFHRRYYTFLFPLIFTLIIYPFVVFLVKLVYMDWFVTSCL